MGVLGTPLHSRGNSSTVCLGSQMTFVAYRLKHHFIVRQKRDFDVVYLRHKCETRRVHERRTRPFLTVGRPSNIVTHPLGR